MILNLEAGDCSHLLLFLLYHILMQVYRIFYCFCHNILVSFCRLNSDLSSKVNFVNLQNVSVSYTRTSDEIQSIQISGNHPTLSQIRFSMVFYTKHPTIKCEMLQSNDYGKTWDTIWTDVK